MTHRRITYSDLRKWEENGFFNPHDLELLVSVESFVNLAFPEERPVESVLENTEKEHPVLIVTRSTAGVVFDCSRTTLAKNSVPGVTWKGSPRSGLEANVAIDLNHEVLRSFNLLREHFVDGGIQRFIQAEEARKRLDLKCVNSIYSKFSDDEKIRMGGNLRFSVDAVERKSEVRSALQAWPKNYEVIPGGRKC